MINRSPPEIQNSSTNWSNLPSIRTSRAVSPGMLKAFDYVMKEGNYLPLNEKSFDLKEFCELSKKKKNSRAALIVKEFEEAPPEVVMENNKDFMLLHGKHMQAYVDWRQKVERRSKFVKALTQKVYVVPAPGYYTPWNVEIASWLTTNIRQPRKKRQKQLWIQGEGGIGKTTMREMIEEWYSLSVYLWPKDERWWDAYGDGEYDIIILDEFRSQKMITELNPILSGDSISLSRRGMAPVVKRDNLPVIILSNYTPEESFPNATEHGKLAPLLDRLTVVKCEGPIRIVQGRPPEEILDEHFPDLPPAPPGSSMVLTDEYEDIFPLTPPEYEIIDDEEPAVSLLEELGRSSARVAMRDEPAFCRLGHAPPASREVDFGYDNDPYYFDKISKQGRAAFLAARNI